MIITKTFSFLGFKQSTWLQPYISWNTEKEAATEIKPKKLLHAIKKRNFSENNGQGYNTFVSKFLTNKG